MQEYLPLIYFILLIGGLFVATRYALQMLFYIFRIFGGNDQTIVIFITLLYLPGTILHELAHFVFAIACFLRVRHVSIIPVLEKNYVKLGHVTYEKQDIVRSIIVGIAPFFAGIGFFWLISYFKLFPSQSVLINILLGYLMFTVSSTMFSSKQDLIDIIYLIPLVIIIGGVIYIFDFKITLSIGNLFINGILYFLNKVNMYLLISLAINIALIIVAKGLKLILRR